LIASARKKELPDACVRADEISPIKVRADGGLGKMKTRASRRSAEDGQFLFLHTSKGVTFDKASNKLTLTAVSAVTLFFTDRRGLPAT